MTHSKNPISLVGEIESAPQMLSLNDEYTLCFVNFLIIGLCSSSANC